MEIRNYWKILLRRWWIAVALTAAAAAVSFLTSPLSQAGYTASLRVLISVQGEPPRGPYFTFDGYYSMLSTEYLTDDVVEVVRSQSFRDKVIQEMRPPPEPGFSVTAQPRSERQPRIVRISVSAGSEDEARRGGEAAARVATQRISEYFPQLGRGAGAVLIDSPEVSPPGAASRNYVDILLRTLVGAAAGIALVFFLHYVDTTLYDADDVERHLGVPVLGRIPRDT